MARRWGPTPRASLARFGPAGPLLLAGGGQRVLLEVRAAQTVRFWENFIKQKLKSAPDIVGAGQVRSGPGPHPGVRRPVQVQGEGLQPWSLGRLGQNLADVLPTWGHGQRDVLDLSGPNSWVGVAPEWFWRYVQLKQCISGNPLKNKS